MNNKIRALLYIHRNKWKALLIIIVFILLSSITIVTPLITEALENVKGSLISKTKPVIIVHYDLLENIDDVKLWQNERRLHKETFKEFYEKLNSLESNESINSINYSLYKFIFSDTCSVSNNDEDEKIILYGVDVAAFPDLYDYNINMVSGNALTQNEIDKGERVCIVSDQLLINGEAPVIGDMVPVEICCFDSYGGYPYYSSDNLRQKETVYLKIKGIFHGNIAMFDYDSKASEYSNYIYCPKKIVENCQLISERQLQKSDNQITIEGDPFNYYYPGIRDISIELKNRNDINKIKKVLFENFDYLNRSPANLTFEGEPIEQHYYCESIEDIYNRSSWIIDNLAKTSETVNLVAFVIFIVVTVIITIIMLKTREREMGLYLSIGEKKVNLIKQILMELFILYMIGVISAVLIVVMSVKPINSLLINTMIKAESSTSTTDDLGNRLNREALIDLNEIINETEIKLNLKTIETNAVIEIIIILMASAVVSFSITRIKPKELLLE